MNSIRIAYFVGVLAILACAVLIIVCTAGCHADPARQVNAASGAVGDTVQHIDRAAGYADANIREAQRIKELAHEDR